MTAPRRSTVMDDLTVVAKSDQHWPAVSAIYTLGIATGNATFEGQPPSWEQFDADKLAEHRYVAIGSAGDVLGWVAASPVSDRCVYTGVVEHSVYVHPSAGGQGIGRLLLDELVASSRKRRHLDDSVRCLPREHRQPGPAPPGRLPRGRRATQARADDARPLRRAVA